MIFIVIETHKIPFLKSKLPLKIIPSELLLKEYKLAHIEDKLENILKIFIENKIKGKLILPYLSKELFLKFYPQDFLDKIKPNVLKSSLFEELIAPTQNILPSKNGYYYFVNDLLEKPNNTLEKLLKFNQELRYNKLLIENPIKKSLKDILIYSIEELIYKELEGKDLNLFDGVDLHNETFFLNGIADFILEANKFYNKEEVKTFLLEEFKELK